MQCRHTLSLRRKCSLSQISFKFSSHLQRQAHRVVNVSRWIQTSTSESREPKSKNESKAALLDRVVDKLNDSIKKHPGETIAVLFASDIGSVGAMYGIISLTGLEFSPEFALAFAASRPFRRLRLPLDLAVAAGLSKVYPAFSKVRLLDLANALPSAPALSRILRPGLLSKTMDKTKEVIDSYGAAYLMGSRLAGVAVVCPLYVLIKLGVDVMPIIASLGMEGVGEVLGDYAAAVVFGSAIYPLTLGVSGYIVPVVAQLRRSIMP